jgi:hypothetical protein
MAQAGGFPQNRANECNRDFSSIDPSIRLEPSPGRQISSQEKLSESHVEGSRVTLLLIVKLRGKTRPEMHFGHLNRGGLGW